MTGLIDLIINTKNVELFYLYVFSSHPMPQNPFMNCESVVDKFWIVIHSCINVLL